MADYFRGTAKLRSEGLYDIELGNIDRVTRYQSVTSGCLVDGTEWITREPNNLMLTGLWKMLGPMPGTYRGPYPTETDARLAALDGEGTPWEELTLDRVRVAGRDIHLRAGLGRELTAAFAPPAGSEPGSDFRSAERPKAALWEGTVLVLDMPSHSVLPPKPLVLIDGATGKIIAYLAVFDDYDELPEQWT